MSDRDFESADRERFDDDHWGMFADAMDLTIEGHRLIAREIGYEARLAWRSMVSWMRTPARAEGRGRSSPPV